ncbi:Gas vesicle protein [Natrinema salifodinae]|uniref:Gas vesicle protein A n=2 Tax=Natrinema salifodinae TaxID=1202768 RepID=A0A1I0M916_9EURY|nr:Gas vesicle protein [Natrinema salifodinae]
MHTDDAGWSIGLQTQSKGCYELPVKICCMAQPQRRPDSSSLAEVLDRVLDKGVVIDVWARISVVGIELLTIEARVVVASVDTFLHYAEEIAKIEQATAEGDLDELEELEVEPRPESSPQSASE